MQKHTKHFSYIMFINNYWFSFLGYPGKSKHVVTLQKTTLINTQKMNYSQNKHDYTKYLLSFITIHLIKL